MKNIKLKSNNIKPGRIKLFSEITAYRGHYVRFEKFNRKMTTWGTRKKMFGVNQKIYMNPER